MGLCTSVLGTVKFTHNPEAVKDLQKQLQNSLPLTIVAPAEPDPYADMPSLMDVREVVNQAVAVAAVAALDALETLEDMPSVASDKLTNEIRELDVTLNKMNRKIFPE
jgi:hypothetical protein